MQTKENSTKSLKKIWEDFQKKNPKVRIFDAAKQLGVSECELLASACDGESVISLKPNWSESINSFPKLGFVMALTRNEAAVSEIRGIYANIRLGEKNGVALGKIDLRIFHENWFYGFAIKSKQEDGSVKKSLQFFDGYGTAVHKVHLNEKSNHDAFDEFIGEFRNETQNDFVNVLKKSLEVKKDSDIKIDVEELRKGWTELTDTHQIFGFLAAKQLSRIQAFENLGEDLARKISTKDFCHFLEEVANRNVKLMTFIGNDGMIQIFSNYIKNVKEFGDWINILDEDFNMHLKMGLIDTIWVVKKKKGDGYLTSVEVFDSKENNIALFFNKKKENELESQDWLEIVNSIGLEKPFFQST